MKLIRRKEIKMTTKRKRPASMKPKKPKIDLPTKVEFFEKGFDKEDLHVMSVKEDICNIIQKEIDKLTTMISYEATMETARALAFDSEKESICHELIIHVINLIDEDLKHFIEITDKLKLIDIKIK